ncbi:MAG: hypothetical protein KC544_16265, partial [Gemmatimonadetes bacterium]|nr:hypothetical protein [Gemmatimonadota bacterium]
MVEIWDSSINQGERMMTREWVAYIFCLLGFWQTVMAQREVPLTVSLRDSAGTPIVGERVVLEQFPAGT